MSEELERDVLGKVGIDRRAFVKRLIIGTAFAVPAVSSFSMASLSASSTEGQTPNGGQPPCHILGIPLPPVICKLL
jgi:hypothetical protein